MSKTVDHFTEKTHGVFRSEFPSSSENSFGGVELNKALVKSHRPKAKLLYTGTVTQQDLAGPSYGIFLCPGTGSAQSPKSRNRWVFVGFERRFRRHFCSFGVVSSSSRHLIRSYIS